MSTQPRKPLKWVGSAKRDLDGMPEDVQDVFGHAIDLAQAGGKHPDAKALTGLDLRIALLPEEVQERHQDAEGGPGPDQGTAEGCGAGF